MTRPAGTSSADATDTSWWNTLGSTHCARDRARRERINLVFGASDREHNDAVALLKFAGDL